MKTVKEICEHLDTLHRSFQPEEGALVCISTFHSRNPWSKRDSWWH